MWRKRKKRIAKICISIICFTIIALLVRKYIDNKNYWIIECAVASIAAILVYWELKESKKVNEAETLMEINNAFIQNERLTSVEHIFERYNYYSIKEKEEFTCANIQKAVEWKNKRVALENKMRKMFDIEKRKRQYLIDYLVYLEGVASLINTKVLRIDTISDLMAYRYFIAVNNPVVQEIELEPYKDAYRGCYEIYSKWESKMETIPLKENALVKDKTRKFNIFNVSI